MKTKILVACHLSLVTVFQDLRYGLRMFVKNPGFAIVAVSILALGIGINTAIFSVLNAVLLRSLPVPNPHELRSINWMGRNPEMNHYMGAGMGETSTGMRYAGSFPYPAYRSFRERGAGFAEVFAYFPLYSMTLHTRNESSVTEGMMVSGNFFTGYGRRTLIGRTITPEDDRIGAAPVVVITYRWWEQHFDLDPTALGQTMQINKNPFTIIGVLPKDFVGLIPGDPTEFYVPLSTQPQLTANFPLESTIHWWIQIMARLAPDANESQAQASLEVLFRQILAVSTTKMEQPSIMLEDGSRGPLIQRQSMAQPLWALLAVVGLVLLITCANIASLLLVRGVSRQHEMAIRTAIGAGRWRLIRQSLTESLLLSLTGAAVGLIFAEWSKSALLGFFISYMDNLHIDARTDANVLAFTLGLSVFTAVLSGLLPAFRVSRVNPAAGLKDRAAMVSPRLRLGKLLVSAQVGLSLLLVVGAGLMIRSFANLSSVDPGFNPKNLLLFRLDAGQSGYDDQKSMEFFGNVRQSVAAIPGVQSVALSDLALLSGGMSATSVTLPGNSETPDASYQTNRLFVSDSFFSTLGMNLVLGRDFNPNDSQTESLVAIVNEMFVNSFLPGVNPIGQAVKSGSTEYRIVGVCSDAKYQNLRDKTPATMYLAYQQKSRKAGAMFFEVRSVLPPLSLVPAIRKIVSVIDPTIPITQISTQQQNLERSIVQERLFASLCGFLAVLAMLLSCIGLYGLMAYTVKRRTIEIGIRMALGARPRDVAMPIVREAFWLAFLGVIVCIPVAYGLAHLIRSFLYGIEPYDPATLIGGAALFLVVAILSAWIPARRAARVDPMTAMRCE
ncbi:MAG: ABC transporter permease [Candidatus Omnitrophota bacterium]